MRHGLRRRRSALATASGTLALAGVLVGSLAGCSGAAEEVTLPRPATTVHADPGEHTVDAARPTEAGETYAPFLAWKDRDTVEVTTFGSSTAGCLPIVLADTVDADGAYRALVDLAGEPGRPCTDDWAAQEWDLPLPAELGSAAVVRLQLAGEPETAYEYPMGDSRPG